MTNRKADYAQITSDRARVYIIKGVLSTLPLLYSNKSTSSLQSRSIGGTNACYIDDSVPTPCFSSAHVVGGQGKGLRRQGKYTGDDLHARSRRTTCARLDSPNLSSLRGGARKCCRCAKCPCLCSCQPIDRLQKCRRRLRESRYCPIKFVPASVETVEKLSVDLQS